MKAGRLAQNRIPKRLSTKSDWLDTSRDRLSLSDV